MEYLKNWTDTSIVQNTGWGGSVRLTDNLILTAYNGWHTFGWNIEEMIGKEITIEFNYKFTDVTNWWHCFLTNIESVSYGSPLKYIDKSLNEWHYFSHTFTPTQKFIGINIRGVDETGYKVICELNNIRVHTIDRTKVSLNKSGITTLSFIGENKNNKCFMNQDSITANEFYEI